MKWLWKGKKKKKKSGRVEGSRTATACRFCVRQTLFHTLAPAELLYNGSLCYAIVGAAGQSVTYDVVSWGQDITFVLRHGEAAWRTHFPRHLCDLPVGTRRLDSNYTYIGFGVVSLETWDPLAFTRIFFFFFATYEAGPFSKLPSDRYNKYAFELTVAGRRYTHAKKKKKRGKAQIPVRANFRRKIFCKSHLSTIFRETRDLGTATKWPQQAV